MTTVDTSSSSSAASAGEPPPVGTQGRVPIPVTPPTSWASSPAARKVMRGNRKRDTRPEMALRRAAHALGLRYRVAARPVAGQPWTADMVFTRARVAVFVDGCYWHGCPDHFKPPRTNAAYWSPKIARNRARDQLVDGILAGRGWISLRIWEHEPVPVALNRVLAAVRPEGG
jgi:DNA mismatch endonuclease (patch repair protein)